MQNEIGKWSLIILIIYRVVERDGVEYFVEMMPALHNYITVDTSAFLSDPNRVLALCSVIKKV